MAQEPTLIKRAHQALDHLVSVAEPNRTAAVYGEDNIRTDEQAVRAALGDPDRTTWDLRRYGTGLKTYSVGEIAEHLAKRIAATTTNMDGTPFDQYQVAGEVDSLLEGLEG